MRFLGSPPFPFPLSFYLAENMEALLQCSVCLSVPKCNIYQCNESDLHLICQDCHSKLPRPPKCPTCRNLFPTTPKRSRLAEQVVKMCKCSNPIVTASEPTWFADMQGGLSEMEAMRRALQGPNSIEKKSHRKSHRKRHPKLHQFLLIKKFLKWQFIQVCFSKLGFGAIFGVISVLYFFY